MCASGVEYIKTDNPRNPSAHKMPIAVGWMERNESNGSVHRSRAPNVWCSPTNVRHVSAFPVTDVAALMAWITRFQIVQQERVLKRLFGAKFDAYCSAGVVRREQRQAKGSCTGTPVGAKCATLRVTTTRP